MSKFSWKCLGCGAVCNSPEKPMPCEFCGSREVVDYKDAPASAPPDKQHE